MTSNTNKNADFGWTDSHNANSASNDLLEFGNWQSMPTSASNNNFTSDINTNTQIPQNASYLPQVTPCSAFDDSFLRFQPPSSKKLNSSYMDVVIWQNFDGYWDHNNKQLLATVLNTSTLQEPPVQIQNNMASMPFETIWMTMLVLLWLETACMKDQKAWLLIHQKGCEWLKEQGVDYEAQKCLGRPYI